MVHYCQWKVRKTLLKVTHKTQRPRYVGRPAAASPATGLARIHLAEQKKLVQSALVG